ncbi:hypothetical protein E6H16_05945 [Candidatus Bathyarchaeota archaeon]|nr:MAG: hypothetical protein E6H23_02570 [Candidatus Bathyarchaeota archaeon]TMI63185.1 MAG: hypothetical protein E6H16_05945 [Candidatus Bathyarchaeota archaeon]
MAEKKYSTVSLWAGVVLIGISIYFFLASVSLISPPATAVVAGLLSAIIGFVMLSSGASLIRTYVLAHIAEQDTTTKTS